MKCGVQQAILIIGPAKRDGGGVYLKNIFRSQTSGYLTAPREIAGLQNNYPPRKSHGVPPPCLAAEVIGHIAPAPAWTIGILHIFIHYSGEVNVKIVYAHRIGDRSRNRSSNAAACWHIICRHFCESQEMRLQECGAGIYFSSLLATWAKSLPSAGM